MLNKPKEKMIKFKVKQICKIITNINIGTKTSNGKKTPLNINLLHHVGNIFMPSNIVKYLFIWVGLKIILWTNKQV
jgi:hypothetical protein